MRLRKSSPKKLQNSPKKLQNSLKNSPKNSPKNSNKIPFIVTAYALYSSFVFELGYEPVGWTPEELISSDIAKLTDPAETLQFMHVRNIYFEYAMFLMNAHVKVNNATQIFQ